jgi:hypothetical protein
MLFFCIIITLIMHKIHRRKNNEIAKDFFCPENCGRSYASYAALYTHMKQKHPDSKPPEMKLAPGIAKQKAGRQVKTSKVEVDQGYKEYDEIINYDCKICKQEDCICFEDIDEDEMDRTIMMFEDQHFIKFMEAMANLNVADRVAWTRNTDDPFEFLSVN